MGRYDREVDGMFTRVCRVARGLGMDTSGWYLQRGSPSKGQAWRLFTTPGASCVFPGLDRGYLGWTGGQARDTLHALAVGMETAQALLWHWRRSCEVCGRDDVVDKAGTRCSRHVGSESDSWERSQQLLADLGEQNYG